ncbi:unnamed protein product [Miscanthus lutarioriparius]|uniref:Uncharacterized protein n=1 Tax=Miscanthus lutarioriparius TaxID=422564 RepID=A0A811MEN2_9POAL|nr:unnamed protein product [Miscanthus lutarioriparius]
MGLGCVAVVCTELRELSLKWCLGVSDMGIQLLALKCRKLTSLDLSYTMITKDSFPAIMKLPNLQELTLGHDRMGRPFCAYSMSCLMR